MRDIMKIEAGGSVRENPKKSYVSREHQSLALIARRFLKRHVKSAIHAEQIRVVGRNGSQTIPSCKVRERTIQASMTNDKDKNVWFVIFGQVLSTLQIVNKIPMNHLLRI
jgi:hypothetical protein